MSGTAPSLLYRLQVFLQIFRLKRRFPFLTDPLMQLAQAEGSLRPAYEDYITHVSSKEMAVSLRTAAFLKVLCERSEPRNILDLGSGFSSYVFRAVNAKADDGNVLSVDDDEQWLEQTRGFLESNGYPAQLMLWDELRSTTTNGFDLVFHDLGHMALRTESLPYVLGLAAIPDGLIVLDDMHKKPYRMEVRQLVERGPWNYLDLSFLTLDEFGRFAALLYRS